MLAHKLTLLKKLLRSRINMKKGYMRSLGFIPYILVLRIMMRKNWARVEKNLHLAEELLKNPKANKKIIGIGECGLDYYRCTSESVAKQRKDFISQIELANEFNKPLMLHIRSNRENKSQSAYIDALALLKKYSKVKPSSAQSFGQARGNVHFFAGTSEEAKAYLDFGFTLSFTGVVTFTKD